MSINNDTTDYASVTSKLSPETSPSTTTITATVINMTPLPHRDPNNPFAFTVQQLTSLVDRKDLTFLQQIQGVEGLARGLHSSLTRGIMIDQQRNSLSKKLNEDYRINDIKQLQQILFDEYPDSTTPSTTIPTIHQRQHAFGANILPEMDSNSLLQLMWIAFQDKTLILLTISAMISFIVGIYEDMTTVDLDNNGNPIPGVKWVEGVAILVAVLLVVVVGSVNDYQKEEQFRKLNAKKDDRHVSAIRSGQPCFLSIYDIQVGDVLSLEPGDIVAADGIFIQGHNLKCDESAATGESDGVRKASWQDCIKARTLASTDHDTLEEKISLIPNETSNQHFERKQLPDPFLVSGSKVLEGICTYMVTAVGIHSFHGRTLMALRVKSEITPLQEKLNVLAENIAKLGVTAAGFLFMVLSIRSVLAYLNADPSTDPTTVISQLIHILITTITVVVVAVPEGLPLAVTLALAYATQRMLKENNLVRILAACETMGNATTVCSDKTGTLTQNKMTVVAGTFGSSFRFRKDPPVYRTDLIDLDNIRRRIPLSVRYFLNQAMAVNSTAFRLPNNNNNNNNNSDRCDVTLVGNKTETAMLNFSRDHLDSEPFECLRACWPVEVVFPFDSKIKAMGTVIRVNYDHPTERTIYRLHIKGAAEVLLSRCSHLLSMHDHSYDTHQAMEEKESCRYDIRTRVMTEHNHARMSKIIQTYGNNSLRTIAICYRDFDSWPTNWTLQDVLTSGGLTMLGVVGIEDPLRPGVKQAVMDCQNAGVCVRMVTGDNMMTAKSIARKCGIYRYGDLAMDGATFRKLSPALRTSLLPHLRVLARSNPEDKRLLVQSLKSQGDIVAVTGDGTNDGPALKAADVGFSMQSGTEVANEASSIILMDNNFSSIVRAISWGRCVNDAVKKFLQFQLTVNITAVLLTIVSALTSSNQKSILTAVQLLWVNLIMDTFAALALATDTPTPKLLRRMPEPRSAPLINTCMWKMIIGQAIYQLVVMTTLLYTNALQIQDPVILQTMIFNSFVFCQIFNELNCRRIDNGLNILKGVIKNRFFMVIFTISVLGQVAIVEYGGTAFQTCPLNGSQWMICILLGFLSIPIGSMIRLVPEHSLFFYNGGEHLSSPSRYTSLAGSSYDFIDEPINLIGYGAKD
ncbi:PMCA-type calcium-translocating P-type ATPase [Halteromyces radiatus]|uniref:PMCA-type calcium-translocating P-type ATPase n=1 Tax=Halteromyces radiatus TaxID=101107 RepID=UPI0022208CF9|nr:PMCA-type calcium-translocating P-type ATPase [Halteromyces radiatus]KAI8098698.1 PMCA-type calcium-translocating P-type ATPase [Halteromyces radiatus]